MKIGIFNVKTGKCLKKFDELWEAIFWVEIKQKIDDETYDKVHYKVTK